MKKSNLTSKKILSLSFLVSLSLSLGYLLAILPNVQAATLNLTANVASGATCGNGIAETGEACDGADNAATCYNNNCNSNCTCPAVGCNGEAGEACSSDNDCSTGQTCNSDCACQVTGGGCIPSTTICSYGSCVAGVQAGSCTNGCAIWSVSQPCSTVACGNGILEAGESCDDGNLINGDGCSASCQNEVGCGNGVVNTGEQCDDGNVTGGDCCSASCQVELNFSGITESGITNTSGSIIWNTACNPTNSSLQWGKTVAVSEGSVSGLSGINYSHNISGLNPSTVYYYRITSNDSFSNTQIANGSFVTAGGSENCNNGLDDDSDGFCDYPASSCSDGSVSGDPECACTPNFQCTPQACQTNNTQNINCVDQTVPKCEADYSITQACDICPGVIPGVCQQVNPTSCQLETIPNCCGNGSCDLPGEGPASCPVDCPVSCLSNWNCESWQPEPCPPSGTQFRNCFDTNACVIPINPPSVTQSCGGVCPGLTCGAGQQINVFQCICEEIVPYCGNGVCEIGENFAGCPADCIDICTPSWTCDAWGECNGTTQSRGCTDLNNCNLNLDKPPTVRSCLAGCDVACGTCQVLDIASCSCFATALCCGDRACENNETNWSCPVDCGIPPTFKISLGACLDGIDNDGDGLVDYPVDPGCSSPSDGGELNLTEAIENVAEVVRDVIDNPQVEKVNTTIAPVIVTTVAISTAASFSLINLLTYLQFFFTQPFAVLFRRKRQKWGVVYDSLSKRPIDLAIVRLYKKAGGQLIQSRVTDKQGRYNFLVEPGEYYMTVTKPKFDFPTTYLKGEKEDVKFLDLYHGETVIVTDKKVTITANIPIDSKVEEKPVRSIIIQHYLRKVQYAISFMAVPLAIVSTIISPGPLTYSMLGVHVVLYFIFRRLGYQKPPKNWGIIHDAGSKKPIGRAITRIYDKQYNKLLETRISDRKGRYSFLVDNNIYYVTAEKLGYNQFKSEDIDLVSKDDIVGNDIPLQSVKEGEKAKTIGPVSSSPITPPPGKVGIPQIVKPKPIAPVPSFSQSSISDIVHQVEDLGVGRQSLEDLIKAKEDVVNIKEDIADKKEELEKLEDKVEAIEESIEQKIEKLDEDRNPPPSNKSIAEQLEDLKKEKTNDGSDNLDTSQDSDLDKSDDASNGPAKNIFG